MKLAMAMLLALGCARETPGPAVELAGDSTAEVVGVVPDTLSADAHLLDEARLVLAFLRGTQPLDTGVVADSVTLYLPAEAGGAQQRLGRDQLTVVEAWRVGGYRIQPPGSMQVELLRPGRHYHCQEADLTSRFPALAEVPHVGVSLRADERASCLQTWNATLLFSTDADRPRLVGVAYDQWEW